ncbi:hypothetical protein HDU97_003946 [Phlyctochytrium planicorne]|nr:hypothetical protein HDU97_003946 [Phlyctochytrium planicorne]
MHPRQKPHTWPSSIPFLLILLATILLFSLSHPSTTTTHAAVIPKPANDPQPNPEPAPAPAPAAAPAPAPVPAAAQGAPDAPGKAKPPVPQFSEAKILDMDPEAKVDQNLEPRPIKADSRPPPRGRHKKKPMPIPERDVVDLKGVRGLIDYRILAPLLVSKGLGIGLVLGGAIIKMPQILKIVMRKSAAGVSFASYALETSAYIAGLAYNVRQGNPFNTYGEHAFMAVANVIVVTLMFHYKSAHRRLSFLLLLTFCFTYSLFDARIVSDTILLSLQWVAILIGVFSKVPQIMENRETRSTGQLSAVTVGLQTVGSLARCYTTITEVGDPVILITYVVATVLNGVVFYQVWLYWGRARRTAKDLLGKN